MPFEWPWKIESFPGPPGQEHLYNVQNLLINSIAGFALIALLIWKFGVPFFKLLLSERRQAIIDAADQVQSTLDETNQMVEDYRRRLDSIEDEAERRLAEAVKEAETLRDQIMADARRDAEFIVRRGHAEVERERAKALVDLRSQFVEDIVRAAGYAAAKSLDDSGQRRLVNDFVAQLGTK